MELYELLDLYMSSGQKLDALWQFFVSIHIAIFGALFLFHKMKIYQIIISLMSYIGFSIINIRAKIYEYEFYASITKEIKDKNLDSLKYVNQFFNQYIVDDRIMITVVVHIFSFLCLSYLLAMSKEPNK